MAEAYSVLQRPIDDDGPLVAEVAAWALRQIIDADGQER